MAQKFKHFRCQLIFAEIRRNNLIKLSVCSSYTRGNCKSQVARLTAENQYKSLSYAVTPLEYRPYENQLELKGVLMKRALTKIHNIIKTNRQISNIQLIDESETEENGQICPFLSVKPSPTIFGYRNKNSVNFGKDVNGNERTVGYSIGKYRDHNLVFIPPYRLPNISELHKEIIKTIQEFVKQSKFHADTASNRNGVWKSAVMRSTKEGEIMLYFLLNPRFLSSSQVEEAKRELECFYTSGPGRSIGITSLYVQVCKYFTPRYENSQYIHLCGTKYITEELNKKKFIISPDSFFQVNSPAAEVLYSTIAELLVEKSVTSLLDVCCGTGTIGILMSDYVDNVHGVDVVQTAVDCAKTNARLNDVDNTEFTCATASKALKEMVSSNKPVVKLDSNCTAAIVNPGRGGLSKKFIYLLRKSTAIKHVIYVSCKPTGNALRNIVDLLVPEDDIIPGKCFVAEKALAIDLFPHTRHCELVISLVR